MKYLVNIGFGNFVNRERIIAVVGPNSSPIRKMKDELKAAGKLIDATQGKKTRSIIVMDSGHVVLSAIAVETIAERINEK